MPEFLPKLKDNKKLRNDRRFSKAVLSLFVPSSHTPFLLLPYFFQAPTDTRATETIMSLECLRYCTLILTGIAYSTDLANSLFCGALKNYKYFFFSCV